MWCPEGPGRCRTLLYTAGVRVSSVLDLSVAAAFSLRQTGESDVWTTPAAWSCQLQPLDKRESCWLAAQAARWSGLSAATELVPTAAHLSVEGGDAVRALLLTGSRLAVLQCYQCYSVTSHMLQGAASESRESDGSFDSSEELTWAGGGQMLERRVRAHTGCRQTSWPHFTLTASAEQTVTMSSELGLPYSVHSLWKQSRHWHSHLRTELAYFWKIFSQQFDVTSHL